MRALIAAALSAVVLLPHAAMALDTFPGAEGFGKATSGGRGGAVYIVSNLNNSGSNSLRNCIDDVNNVGARTCIFRVSGTIQLESPLLIDSGDITIAGQTSPNGIQLRLKPGITAANAKSPIRILASNVFIRNIRVRPGNESAWDSTRGSRDAISIEKNGSTEVGTMYFDHVSAGYGSDESISAFQSGSDITLAYTIMSYPLSPDDHAYGPLFCADQHQGVCERVTLTRNFISNHRWRSPALKSVGCGTSLAPKQHEVVSNLIYNSGQYGLMVVDDHPDANGDGTCANVVANVFARGPYSASPIAAIQTLSDNVSAANRWYAPEGTGSGNDNIRTSMTADPVYPFCREAKISPVTNCTESSEVSPINSIVASVLSTASVPSHVTTKAGAFPRDPLDDHWVAQYAAGTNPGNPDYSDNTQSCTTTSCPTGTYPVIAASTNQNDTDLDGMWNSFETANGLSNTNAADRNNIVPSGTYAGYTYLEKFLDERQIAITP